MGLSWSKSVGVGPFRVNLSRSGVGFSVGGKGFRTGVNAKGRRYSTVSIPGTGLRYNTSGGNAGTSGGSRSKSTTKPKAGCASMIAIALTAIAAAVAVAIIRL